ncbi:hypothetical protein M0R45_033264 [Rubus argutus]|uniref:Uncharacterized protein n=1 Tax=Rubus argutus TaxID=59490 RepID=A0AAW1WK19_RUBAR
MEPNSSRCELFQLIPKYSGYPHCPVLRCTKSTPVGNLQFQLSLSELEATVHTSSSGFAQAPCAVSPALSPPWCPAFTDLVHGEDWRSSSMDREQIFHCKL